MLSLSAWENLYCFLDVDVLLPGFVSIMPSLELVSSAEAVAGDIIVFRVNSLIELKGGIFEVLWVTAKVEIRSLMYLVSCCMCLVFVDCSRAISESEVLSTASKLRRQLIVVMITVCLGICGLSTSFVGNCRACSW
jgi:hypothetical protein